jgi:hypothetical protein
MSMLSVAVRRALVIVLVQGTNGVERDPHRASFIAERSRAVP